MLQAQIKRDNFREILFSYSIPEERVKPRKPQRPSTNWFGFSSHLGWARSQTTNHPSGLVLLVSSLPSETEKASPPLDPSTWRKDRASSSHLLDKRAHQNCRILSKWSNHGMTGLNFAVHFAGSLLTALHCLKTLYAFMLSFIEIIYRTPTHVPLFTKHKQLLSACCVPTHWVYSPSKPQTDLFRVDTSNCCVSWAIHLALF